MDVRKVRKGPDGRWELLDEHDRILETYDPREVSIIPRVDGEVDFKDPHGYVFNSVRKIDDPRLPPLAKNVDTPSFREIMGRDIYSEMFKRPAKNKRNGIFRE